MAKTETLQACNDIIAFNEYPKISGENVTAPRHARQAISVSKPVVSRWLYFAMLVALDLWASGLRSGLASPPSSPFDSGA
jgi:hypothetical protein